MVKHTKWGAQNVRMNEEKQNNITIVDETHYWKRWKPLKLKMVQKKTLVKHTKWGGQNVRMSVTNEKEYGHTC